MKILLFFLTLTAYSTAWAECVSGDCVNGRGTYSFKEGAKYVGEWRYGKKHGKGTQTYADGRILVGVGETTIILKLKQNGMRH